jgi:hypothetical protein
VRGERRRLVLGDECVGVRDLDEASPRQQLGEPSMIGPCVSTIAGPLPPVSSYSIVPADSSTSGMDTSSRLFDISPR